jgi:hypothetical protein
LLKLAIAAAIVIFAVVGAVAFAGKPHASTSSSPDSAANGDRQASRPAAVTAPTRAGRDPRAPRQRLEARDMAIARAAVVHPENLTRSRWYQVASPPDGPRKPCAGSNPDLSRFTLTGKATSAFRAGNVARIVSSVRVYANAGQASLIFQATATPKALRCIGTGMLRDIRAAGRKAGVKARIAAVRVYPQVALASQGAAYQVVFALTSSRGKTEPLPIDVFVFQAGRAIGALSFTAVIAKRNEVGLTRLVASRLSNS